MSPGMALKPGRMFGSKSEADATCYDSPAPSEARRQSVNPIAVSLGDDHLLSIAPTGWLCLGGGQARAVHL